MFKPISPSDSFPEIEKEVLKFWEKNKIFEKSVESRPAGKTFVFFEGPPYANARPGIHHVLARSIKDVINRYKTMKGFRVERRAGWDSHGLPVENQIEKELGFKTKKEIEQYGIEKFNKKCKDSVLRFKEMWEAMTKRMGYWIDLTNAYITYKNEYIESLWYLFKEFYNKGLVYCADKVVPHCPRCQTTLSSHEVAQGYKEVNEDSVFVKFRVTNDKSRVEKDKNLKSQNSQEYFLVWTTTPWTLPANVALAVNPDVDYVKIKQTDLANTDILILAKERLSVLGKGYKVLEELRGQDLLGMEYEPLYPEVSHNSNLANLANAFKVYPAEFVTTAEGTGIVHIAPAFGADDLIVGIQANLPILQPVDLEGNFTSAFKMGEGKFIKDADLLIVADLEKRGILFKVEKYKHDYPFCWRCDSPLLYYAKQSWFIKMSVLRDELLQKNEEINWIPAHLKSGRFGEWLQNVEDWAISRERYWGTPMPVWVCECGAEFCVGSIKELEELVGRSFKDIDLHRPFVDEITFECSSCQGKAKRVPYVLDIWFDSGAMPYAQWHWPFENQEKFEKNFPADFIAEGMDQTRGWFYTLHAISTALFGSVAYRNVISHGLVLDKEGKKMSKSRGNIIIPEEMIEKYSADAVRWFFYSINSAGEDKCFDETKLAEIVRKVFLILWNVYGFFATYANIENWRPSHNHLKVQDRPVLDRWILARLHQTIEAVDKELEKYDFTHASRNLEDFINDLSTWYLRRSRKRFSGENEKDKESAFQTTHEVLVKTSLLIAPFAPFLSEELYQRLAAQFIGSDADLGFVESVHLADFPLPEKEIIDHKVLDAMAIVRKIVEMARSARSAAGIKIRQPLHALYIHGRFSSDESYIEQMEDIIKDEVNVKKLIVKSDGKAQAPKSYQKVVEDGYTVAIDTKITAELYREGLLREIIRLIQDSRKKTGCKPDERVGLLIDSKELGELIKSGEKKLILETNLDYIEFGRSDKVDYSIESKVGDKGIWIGIKK
jgi:isoleucyl-tRNA synthetase